MPKAGHSGQLIITRWKDHTPSDTVPIAAQYDVVGFSVDADGNISITSAKASGEDDETSVVAVKAGVIYPIAPKRINSTNTTATGITIYYQ